jgi:hypothetical protein
MSRAYRIRLSQTEERIVHVADGVCTELQLLPVLSKERMTALLERELAARGFGKVEDGKAVRAEGDGVEIEIDVETGKATVRIEEKTTVQRSAARDVSANVGIGTRERIKAELAEQAGQAIDAAERKLADAAARRLEANLRDVQAELDHIVTRVTGAALKEKAAELGQIETLVEDPETGDLTIQVRL